MKLENWCITYVTFNPYQPPECQEKRLHGQVFGNSNFPDGATITTSPIASVDGEVVVTSSGSRYELGEVDPGYEAAFPGAKQRVLSQATAAK